MRIIQVHNKYQTPGGEDVVVDAEYSLLKKNGHEIYQWIEDSKDIENFNFWEKIKFILFFIWSPKSYRKMKTIIKDFKPDIIHVHNTVPLITPSIYYACKKMKIPVVQTLHNYRLICANGLLFREQKICELCINNKNPFYALKNSCYRNSRLQSCLISIHLWIHQTIGTYKKLISQYICLTDFSRKKNILAGLPQDKIVIKPNFLNYTNNIEIYDSGFALFVGRLSEEKGLETLLKAWKILGNKIPLKIVGIGSLKKELVKKDIKNVEYLGWKNSREILNLMGQAHFLVFPSECYEGFPMTIIEAFSVGLPVVASNLGGIAEIIKNGENGWLFEAGNSGSLIETIQSILNENKIDSKLKHKIVDLYEQKYSSKPAYKNLLDIYNKQLT